MENSEVSKEVDAILENAKVDLDCFEYGKDRAEYAKAIAEMYKTKVEAEKIAQLDRHDNLEAQIEQKKIKNERAMRIVEAALKFVGTTLEVGVPAVLMAKQFEQSLDYEKEGVWTSSTVKNLLRFFRPTKR